MAPEDFRWPPPSVNFHGHEAVLDAVIIGAGVAGSATAIHLAESGLRVQLIDRARTPGLKACGEAVFPRGVTELAGLGVLNRLQDFVLLDRLRFHLGATTAEAKIGAEGVRGIGVRRSLLGEALLQVARQAGVEVIQDTLVETLLPGASVAYGGVETSRGKAEARVIIAADGLRSGLRRQAGLEAPVTSKRYGISAHFGAPAPGAGVDVHFFPGFEVYVTPVGHDLVNVALLCGQGVARSLSGALEDSFLRLISPAIAARGLELVTTPRAAGPFPARSRKAWRHNLLLVGDAAGFFDGISGEGISLALVSARLAADTVRSYLQDGNEAHFQRYNGRLMALQRPSNFLARLTLTLAARPSLAQPVLRHLSSHPRFFSWLVALNSGEVKAGDLGLSAALAMFRAR